jgi:signal transduction protein with GAF and PtsI domain
MRENPKSRFNHQVIHVAVSAASNREKPNGLTNGEFHPAFAYIRVLVEGRYQ